jgi:hypothetical protein
MLRISSSARIAKSSRKSWVEWRKRRSSSLLQLCGELRVSIPLRRVASWIIASRKPRRSESRTKACGIFATVCVYFSSATVKTGFSVPCREMATGWIVFVRCTFAKAAVRDGVTSLIASALCFTANAASVDEPQATYARMHYWLGY